MVELLFKNAMGGNVLRFQFEYRFSSLLVEVVGSGGSQGHRTRKLETG